jgi:CheY-like chemotaxis protein
VHLPALVSDEPAVSVGPDLNGQAIQSRRCRVLIVDDNADAARSLAMLLEMGGHDVRLCYDGDSAVTEAETFHPDVVFLDIGLPGRDGLEVARDLRMRALSPQPVLVALTGYGQAEDVRRSREAGFDHHLVKPADPEAVKALLASGVASAPREREPSGR